MKDDSSSIHAMNVLVKIEHYCNAAGEFTVRYSVHAQKTGWFIAKVFHNPTPATADSGKTPSQEVIRLEARRLADLEQRCCAEIERRFGRAWRLRSDEEHITCQSPKTRRSTHLRD